MLDAVYYLCYTKSYFSANQQTSVQKGADGFRVQGSFQADDGREEVIVCKWRQGKKDVSANDVAYEKLTDHIGKFAAVIIAPDDLEIINDGSELRRKWLDSVLGQVDKRYLESLMQYQRILLQRNAWLKLNAVNPPSGDPELEYYTSQLVLHGTYIHEQRRLFIDSFGGILSSYYQLLSGGKESVTITYQSGLLQKPLDQLLEQSFYHDIRLQRTVQGVHKDDLSFRLNDNELKQYGSQGQKKSFLFALKLAQYAFLRAALKKFPILLLDDIFEKLDQNRMEALLTIISGEDFGQVILTDTHSDRVKHAFGEGAEISFITL